MDFWIVCCMNKWANQQLLQINGVEKRWIGAKKGHKKSYNIRTKGGVLLYSLSIIFLCLLIFDHWYYVKSWFAISSLCDVNWVFGHLQLVNQSPSSFTHQIQYNSNMFLVHWYYNCVFYLDIICTLSFLLVKSYECSFG